MDNRRSLPRYGQPTEPLHATIMLPIVIDEPLPMKLDRLYSKGIDFKLVEAKERASEVDDNADKVGCLLRCKNSLKLLTNPTEIQKSMPV